MHLHLGELELLLRAHDGDVDEPEFERLVERLEVALGWRADDAPADAS